MEFKQNMNDIKWASRVPPEKIRRLYKNEAQQIINEELLADVGLSLYLRSKSILAINKVHMEGLVNCPICNCEVKKSENSTYICNCGWSIGSKELHMTYKGKQYTGLSILGFAENFISDWNNALGDPKAQMRAIDYLLHRFHWEMTENPTRPVAVNYIDGTMSNVMELILELAYSDDISRKNNKDEWLRNKAVAERIWKNRKGE